MLPMNTP